MDANGLDDDYDHAVVFRMDRRNKRCRAKGSLINEVYLGKLSILEFLGQRRLSLEILLIGISSLCLNNNFIYVFINYKYLPAID